MNVRDRLAEGWALVGISFLLGFAVLRLGARGLALPFTQLSGFEWAALLGSLVFFGYGEGVLAFQRHWVPRVLGRVRELRGERRPLILLLAPLYAMSMIAADRARMLGSWALFVAIVILAVWVQRLPEPWRGIVDLGVAAALAWGLLCLLLGARRGS